MPSNDRGQRLRQLRRSMGWTQEVLASRPTSLPRTVVAKIESGYNQVSSFGLLTSLGDAFGVSPDVINAYLDGRLSVEALHAARAADAEGTGDDSQTRLRKAVDLLGDGIRDRSPTEVTISDDLVAMVLPAVRADVVLVLVVFVRRGSFVKGQHSGSLCLQFTPLEMAWTGSGQAPTPHTPESLAEGMGMDLIMRGVRVTDAELAPLGEAIIASARAAT